jgi:tRNA modification GTPase
VEISCHGGRFGTQQIIDSLVRSGARLAHPGEFTKRAFLNGRIDLSQAEAVSDLIHARSELLYRTSLEQLGGNLSKEIRILRQKLTGACALLELELDFTEEGIEFNDRSKISEEIDEIVRRIKLLAETFRLGKIYRNGVKVLIAGRPNVGKSSIFNSLLNENRAIVTAIPGTTRDIIHEAIAINGILFDLYDTAGLREVEDIVELEGIRRTEESSKSAQIILFVIDGSVGLTEEDMNALRKLSWEEHQIRKLIIVSNKTDLNIGLSNARPTTPGTLRISAKTKAGLSELRSALYDIAIENNALSQEGSLIITSVRHRDSLNRAASSLRLVLDEIQKGTTNELLVPDIRNATTHLGEIIGEVTSDDILNDIFSNFCIGK